MTGLDYVVGSLFDGLDDFPASEDPEYLSKQLITYIGNKRGLRKNLELAFTDVCSRVGGRKLSAVDLFAGTGFVSRLLKRHCTTIVANDIEEYSRVANTCFLSNHDDAIMAEVARTVAELNRQADAGADVQGFIRELYSPQDDNDIKLGERVFYTNDNARRLDFFAQAVAILDEPVRSLVMGPLLSAASMHTNTSGVFKGFYKDKDTGIGRLGASAGDALSRITKPIRLEVPRLSRSDAQTRITKQDANELARDIDTADLAYIDPPYNQHPYGSNYFMLNLLCDYVRPAEYSKVSGIPTNWQRSPYNVKKQSLPQMADLLKCVPARFVVVSFNAEGYISTEEMRDVMDPLGRVDEVVIPYNTFRGSRNLRGRSIHVNEHLYILDREG